MNNFDDLLYQEAKASENLCRDCKSLDDCKQSEPGFVRFVDCSGVIAIKRCDRYKTAATNREFKRYFAFSRIPQRFLNFPLDKFQVDNHNSKAVWAVNQIRQSGIDGLNGFVFYGPVGTGKTLCSCLIASEVIRQGKTAIYSSVPNLFQELRDGLSSGNFEQMIEKINSCQCLVLDDLGSERLTEWVGEKLFSIIDYRYANNLFTVITSNYNYENLKKRLSVFDKDDISAVRIMSRLKAMCSFIEIGGTDRRTNCRF